MVGKVRIGALCVERRSGGLRLGVGEQREGTDGGAWRGSHGSKLRLCIGDRIGDVGREDGGDGGLP